MKREIYFLVLFLCICAALSACQPPQSPSPEFPAAEPLAETETRIQSDDNSIPDYFIAVHCEPNNYGLEDRARAEITSSFTALEEMVTYADQSGVKLTIMFSPQLVQYILEDEARTTLTQRWKANGHEFAGHHHSVNHGHWDGYTDQSSELTQILRERNTAIMEPYNGTLTDYMNVLHQLDPSINSGCMNDEIDKGVLPDGIIYDTCSGFSNKGEPGVYHSDRYPDKGVNEYISTGFVNGIQRWWLTHTGINSMNEEIEAESTFGTLDDSVVFGVVTHAMEDKINAFKEWIDFIQSLDPDALHSSTLTEIIETGALPEVMLDQAIVDMVNIEESGVNPQNSCGDGICDPIETNHPDLCPEDCGN